MVTINTAVILAAGLGTRMRPLSDQIPKPLIEIRGKPLIKHCIDLLSDIGFEKICINVHYKADLMTNYLNSLNNKKIIISDEKKLLLDTGGGIKNAMHKIDSHYTFVLNSDILWGQNEKKIFSKMSSIFDPTSMDSLLCLTSLSKVRGYNGIGDFHFKDKNTIDRYNLKLNDPLVYMGVQIIKKELLDTFEEKVFSVNKVWDYAIECKKLAGFLYNEELFHIGTPKMVKEINEI